MSKGRDPYFDVVKAIAIIMVVFCHVMAIAPFGTFPVWINNFRVGMNMPIFFVISGYFVWPMIESLEWRKLLRNVRSYLMPAFFAGIVYTTVDFMITPLSIYTILNRLTRSVFVDPWFITTLIECQLLLFVAWAVGRKMKWMILLIVLSLGVIMCRPSYIHGDIHFACLLNMMPHFVFGAIVLRKYRYHFWENRVWGVISFVTFMSFVLLEGNADNNGMSFYTADSSISAFRSARGAACFVARPVLGLLGSVGVMSLIKIALDAVPSLVGLAKIGTLTLGIYIFHLWPFRQLRSIAWVGSSWWSVALTSIAMLSIFSVVTWFLMERTGRFRKWIWGK